MASLRLRKRPFVLRLGLWAYMDALRRHFDATEIERDRHAHWVAIQGATTILHRLGIRHPPSEAGPTVWRAFLAHVVAAAEEGDAERALTVMELPEWNATEMRSDFGAPAPPPPSAQPLAERPGQEADKIFTARDIEELLSPIKNMSSLQIQRHARPHIGKWLTVQSVIRDINENEHFLYAYIGRNKFGPLAYLAFRKDRWAVHLETMDRGDRLAAEGCIVKLDYSGIYLDDCALVDLQENDNQF